VDIAAGYLHSLAISADHAVIAWGDNTYGQASPPSNLTDVVAIAAGSYHSLALKGDGTILGWGDNTYWSSISTGRVDWGGSDRYEP
jgi:alpha-tubulin suppressor-like RCC1 family protein